MPQIRENPSGVYTVDTVLVNNNIHHIEINADEVGITGSKTSVTNGNHLFSKWIAPDGNPYATLEDLISDLRTFFFL